MAVLTRLASTLTARYFPSQTLTDAFYLDGRLFGKRETRQADITIEKNERGYFMSVFAHPKLADYEPGMMPPYEPKLRGTCNEVKFGHKEIDGMIEGFLTTAVDVTGKSRIAEADDRSPYFSGVIIRDSEAFAVTIGTGLAFLYRDDTLYPLTDAGIPMEPIDGKGNKVADFLYYCSSKTANALWSNFFTLAQDDCIILCNKEVYDALGQRELLRILDEADDQCDAAGIVITQASARMPDVPMQFAISFVEDVVSDEKKGLFGFRKKAKEEDTSDMSIESTTEGGLMGAAANAAAAFGFAGSMTIDDYKPSENQVVFGDGKTTIEPPASNQQAGEDKGFVVDGTPAQSGSDFVQFLDPSVEKDVSEVSPEEIMKTLFAADAASAVAASAETATSAASAETVAATAKEAADTTVQQVSSVEEPSIFVNNAVNPFAMDTEVPETSTTVSKTEFVFAQDSDADKTKPVERLDAAFMEKLERESKASAVSAVKVDDTEVIKDAVESMSAENGAFVFAPVEEDKPQVEENNVTADAEFDPYSVGSQEEMLNAEPLVFGDDGSMNPPTEEEIKEAQQGIPVPEFTLDTEKPDLEESDKLGVDFPVNDAGKSEDNAVEITPENTENNSSEENAFVLPFEGGAQTVNDEPKEIPVADDIPEMPVFGANEYQDPTATSNSDEPVNAQDQGVYSYGQMVNDESMATDAAASEAPQELAFDASALQSSAAGSAAAAGAAYAAATSAEQAVSEAPSEQPYQPFGGEPYTDGVYGYTPGQFQENYNEQPEQTNDNTDSDWINAILGIDDNSFDSGATAGEDMTENGGSTAMADNNGYTPYNPTPVNQQYNPTPRNTGSAGAPRTASSGTGNRGNGGNGGNGGQRKVPKLNRNGYMFLAFVIICLVCLIILISAIVKSCRKDDAEVAESISTDVAAESVATEIAVETTAETTETTDPSAPIGKFQFSDNIGYRTWWDLFNTVYGISDIANTSDPRISIIISYNGLDASYTPSSGDVLLLPPVGVLDGTIPVTFVASSATTSSDTTADNSVNGEVQTVDGSTTESAAETDAATAETEAVEEVQ